MEQSIQEWTKQILWKTALKKFTESTLEYFAPYDLWNEVLSYFTLKLIIWLAEVRICIENEWSRTYRVLVKRIVLDLS